ncbi:MAG: histidine kinase [Oscillospiraceae bacterium]
MDRQYTSWGYIDWYSQRVDENDLELDVGIVTISPFAHMSAHVHYNEQVLYMFHGNGYSLLDGQRVDMPSGSIYHWKSGVIHEMWNTGDTPCRHLMVSCSEEIQMDNLSFSHPDQIQEATQKATQSLYLAVDGLRSQFLDTMRYTWIIFDDRGNKIAHSRFFPSFCRSRCADGILSDKAPCMHPRRFEKSYAEEWFKCPYGLTSFLEPILFRGMFLGYVQGGFIHTAYTADDYMEDVYDVPKSAIYGVHMLLRRIVRAIVNFCEFDVFKKELVEKDLDLADKKQYQELLVADLKTAETTMTDLKINNHFLFNTLNQMASMALDGGVFGLYQSIVDLSKMFHYTLRNQSNTISLDKEFGYLDAYLNLQKLRYKSGLTICYDIDVEQEQWMVPFNFLMPIAENAFTHGFVDETEKHLDIQFHAHDGALDFSIGNNGNVLDRDTCRRLTAAMSTNSAHGLSMVYSKLKAIYNEEFSFEIQSGAAFGTRIRLLLPAKRMEEFSHDQSCHL